jgi:hypothetical protein
MRAEIDAQMEAESTNTTVNPGIQAPILFAPSTAASSSVVPASVAPIEDKEQPVAEQEEDTEMLDAPHRWTAWDDDDSGMGPYTG